MKPHDNTKTANDNSLPFDVDPTILSRYLLGGAAVGGGTAALVALLRDRHRAKVEEREREQDPGVITLTLPSKTAEDKSAEMTKKVDLALSNIISTEKEERVGVKANRSPVGKFVKKADADANWQTLAAAILGAGGAGVGAYALIDHLHREQRLKKLKQDVEAQKHEYLDVLSKAGEAVFMSRENVKQADSNDTFSLFDMPLGVAAAMAALGIGGTAYMTKRYLDKADPVTPEIGRAPQIKRIVFRTADGEQKSASERDIDITDAVPAVLGVMCDVMSGKDTVLSKCAEALTAEGITADTLYKEAADDREALMRRLAMDTELRRQIGRAYMESHPVAKYFQWTTALPGLSHIADKKVMQGVHNALYKQSSLLNTIPSAATAAAVTRAMNGNLEASPEAQRAASRAPDEAASARRRISVEAGDANAEAFLEANKDRLTAALAELAASGKV